MRYFLFPLFIFVQIIAQAQRPDVVLFAGPQLTTANYQVRDVKQSTSLKPGLMAGIGFKVPFENRLYFFPAAYYSLKGYKVQFSEPAFPPTELATNNNTTIHTLEIAPLFQYDFKTGPSHLFVRFGPAIDFAFYGRERFDTLNGEGTVNRAMKFSFGDYGRITASANLHFGYESVKGYQLSAFYAHGMGSMNNADNGPVILHRIFGISGGYTIHRKPRTKKYRRKY